MTLGEKSRQWPAATSRGECWWFAMAEILGNDVLVVPLYRSCQFKRQPEEVVIPRRRQF